MNITDCIQCQLFQVRYFNIILLVDQYVNCVLLNIAFEYLRQFLLYMLLHICSYSKYIYLSICYVILSNVDYIKSTC